MRKTKKGFTLVELLVVIAILAILASVAVVGYSSFLTKANESNAKTEAHQIKTAITSSLVVPTDVYTISTGVTIEFDETNSKYLVKGMPTNGVDLNAKDLVSDFAGLPGVLSISGTNLVYTPDSGVDPITILSDVTVPAENSNSTTTE